MREEFHDQWRGYFEAKRGNPDKEQLATLKAVILDAQNKMLDARRKEAATQLREQRDLQYAGVLAKHREQRADLRERQARGESSTENLDGLIREGAARSETGIGGIAYPRGTRTGTEKAFRRAAKETTKPPPKQRKAKREQREPFVGEPNEKRLRVNNGLDALGGAGLGALGAIAAIGEKLFDGFFGGGEAEPAAAPQRERSDPDEPRRDDAARASTVQAGTETRATEEAALLASWDNRRRRKRERD